MGVNPIKKTITLKEGVNSDDYYLLQLNTNGTALMTYYYKHEEETKYKEYPVCQLKYTYNAEKEEIYMIVEKYWYDDESSELLTYGEIYSKIKKEAENQEQEKEGMNYLNVIFGAQITYTYKIENDKITLTEKFTGVKNLLNSACRYYDSSDDYKNYREAKINNTGAYIEFQEDGYSYYYSATTLDTDNKTIEFEKERYKMPESGDNPESKVEPCGNVPATYTEDIAAGTVTIKIKDKDEEYICKFEGEVYTQVE